MEKQANFLLAATVAVAFLSAAAAADVPAIFVLGDSTADVGNNNFLQSTSFLANFPFNGIDFPGGVATGRFTNGYNAIDLLARLIGFQQSPPPYLSLNDTALFTKGVSFASAGSGILDVTGQNRSLSMNKQLDLMQKTADEISASLGEKRTPIFLSKSLFIISTGSNDMFGFSAISSALNTTKEQYAILLADNLQSHIQRLYKIGARKFAVAGTTPVGCVPSLRRLSPSNDCNEDLNDLSQQFNVATMHRLRQLQKTTSRHMTYSFVRAYRVISDAIKSPSKLGFKNVRSACCGSGLLNAGSACLPNSTVCSNRNDHLFWDRVHPSQATYKVLADRAYTGDRRYVRPINVRRLVNV